MNAVFAFGEYLFAIILGIFIFLWVLLCMFAELPGLPRYLRIRSM